MKTDGAEGTLADPSTIDRAISMEDYFHRWLNWTDGFMEWERQQIILGQPSESTMAKHRKALKWVLRTLRGMHSVVKDPEFPLPAFAKEVDGRLLQLEESWKLIHGQTMTEDEADAVIKSAFPDER